MLPDSILNFAHKGKNIVLNTVPPANLCNFVRHIIEARRPKSSLTKDLWNMIMTRPNAKDDQLIVQRRKETEKLYLFLITILRGMSSAKTKERAESIWIGAGLDPSPPPGYAQLDPQFAEDALQVAKQLLKSECPEAKI